MQKALKALDAEVRALGWMVVQKGRSVPWWRLRIGSATFWLSYSVEGWRASRKAFSPLSDCTPAPSAEMAIRRALAKERTAMQNQLIWMQSKYNEICKAAHELRQRVDSAEEDE
jgi:hypothetical protein